MTVLRQYNSQTSQWDIIFTGGDGPTGPTGPVGPTGPDAFTPLIDAKGDLIVGSAPDTIVRVPVGTNGQALVADSSATAGVKWSNVTSSGEDDQIVIATRMFS